MEQAIVWLVLVLYVRKRHQLHRVRNHRLLNTKAKLNIIRSSMTSPTCHISCCKFFSIRLQRPIDNRIVSNFRATIESGWISRIQTKWFRLVSIWSGHSHSSPVRDERRWFNCVLMSEYAMSFMYSIWRNCPPFWWHYWHTTKSVCTVWTSKSKRAAFGHRLSN